MQILTFPIISLWELKVAIATRVLIQPEKEHNFLFPLPKDAMCVIWKELASRFQRRCRLKMLTDNGRTDNGRTPDACIYYKLTYEPSAQVS